MVVKDINEQAKPFLIINPMILNYSKKYILGTDNDSLKLFFKLCNMRVYVNGFVDDRLNGMTIYHKKIYKMEQIASCDSILLTLDSERKKVSGIAVCDNPVVINPTISYSNIYIYGAGFMGRWVTDYLTKKDIEVRGLIDSDIKKVDTSIQGVKVYGKETLKTLRQGTAVIEAGKHHQEIDLAVCELNESVDRYYIDTVTWRDDIIWIDNCKTFGGAIWFDKGFEDRKIYLCGQDYDLVCKYFEIFKILDFERVCIAKWAECISECECDEICCIEDALLEEDRLIIFCAETVSKEDLEKLNNLGLERGKDFCDMRCNIWEKLQYINLPRCQGLQMLDINLAYTRNMSGDFPGIAVLGRNQEEDFKIAVLGGSTATAGYFCGKSWPEILYEKYCGSNVTIFNGAVEGYTSSQELIKLMRDIVWLKPDLVIAYDGYNDITTRGAHPETSNIFEIPYMKTIMEYASGKIRNETSIGSYDIFCGIPSTENAIDVWLKNIEYMNAVCEINNIRFISFMQPIFYSKPKMALKWDIVLSKKWNFQLKTPELVEKPAKEFRKRATEICKTHEYVYDLSHIFDDKDVYIDLCHVFEDGNRIIADEIYKILGYCP